MNKKDKIKIEQIGFVQAMDGNCLWINTTTDETVKIIVKDKNIRDAIYCTKVKIIIETI